MLFLRQGNIHSVKLCGKLKKIHGLVVKERVTGEKGREEVLRENKGMMGVRSEGIFPPLG